MCQKASLTLLLWSSVIHALELPRYIGDGVVETLCKSVLRSTVAHGGAAVPVAFPGVINVVNLRL